MFEIFSINLIIFEILPPILIFNKRIFSKILLVSYGQKLSQNFRICKIIISLFLYSLILINKIAKSVSPSLQRIEPNKNNKMTTTYTLPVTFQFDLFSESCSKTGDIRGRFFLFLIFLIPYE